MTMKRLLAQCLMLCCLGTVSPAMAATQSVEVTATGYGETEDEALGDALARAVTQVKGGSASISTGVVRGSSTSHYADNYGGEATVSTDVKVRRSPDFAGGGAIESYQVLSTVRKDKGFETKVKAQVARYVAPTRGGTRDTLAILPVRITNSAVRTRDETLNFTQLGHELYEQLQEHLLYTGSFSVLDRVQIDKAIGELNLIGSELTGSAEKAKLQNVRGADYVLIPTLEIVGDGRTVNPVTGQYRQPEVTLQLQVLVPATTELVYAGRASSKGSMHDNGRALVEELSRKVVADFDASMHGSSRVADTVPAAAGAESPRDSRGVRLPFDP